MYGLFLIFAIAAIAALVVLGPAIAAHLGAPGLPGVIGGRINNVTARMRRTALRVYYRDIVPRMMTVGLILEVLIGFLVIETALAAMLGSDWKWGVMVGAVLIGIASITLIEWNRRRINAEYSETVQFATAILALFALGVTNFVLGHLHPMQDVLKDKLITWVGVAEILTALIITTAIGNLAVRLAAFGVYSLEGVTNVLARVAIAIATNGRQGLAQVFGPTGIEIAPEERWVAWVNGLANGWKRAVFPVLALGLIWNHPKLTLVAVIFGTARQLMWKYLDLNSVETSGRRRFAALTFEVLFYIGAAVLFLNVFFDGSGTEIDALFSALSASIIAGLKALVKGLPWILAAVVAGVAAVFLPKAMPKKSKGTRGLLRAVAVIGLLVSILGLGVTWFGQSVSEAATAVTLKFVPFASVGKGKQVRITWPALSGAVKYHISKRADNSDKFCTLSRDSVDRLICVPEVEGVSVSEDGVRPLEFPHEARSFVDDSVSWGDKIHYRITAIMDGKEHVSAETDLVTVPDEPKSETDAGTAANDAGTPKPKGAPKKSHDANAPQSCEGSCGNPFLDKFDQLNTH